MSIFIVCPYPLNLNVSLKCYAIVHSKLWPIQPYTKQAAKYIIKTDTMGTLMKFPSTNALPMERNDQKHQEQPVIDGSNYL